MDKTREEFIVWIRQAINDKRSVAHQELYQFLVNCFARADVNRVGSVDVNGFDSLIEEAAAMPRKYGFAPKTEEMYPTVAQRRDGRAKLFRQVDKNNTGHISLNDWIEFALNHIAGKSEQLPKDCLGGSAANVSKDEFIKFIKKAVDKNSPEYKELYYFLLKTFQAGDVERCGAVNPFAFDKMIEAAAAAPRRFGLAPRTEEMFTNELARLAKRKEYFATMDVDGSQYISFDEWLDYAYKHIVSKVSTLR